MARKRRTRAEMLELVDSWGLVPLDAYPGPHQPWRCWCRRCGTIVHPTYAVISMARTLNACSECSKRHKSQLFSAPHDEMVEVFMSQGFQPIGPYPGNHKRWPSIHLACMRECAPYPANVKQRGGGCDDCASGVRGRKRRVDEAVATAVMRKAGLVPLVPYPTSGVGWECLCIKCAEVVHPTYDNVRAGAGGCRYCAEYGLGWGEAAIVYLLVHREHLALKVGVAKLTPARTAMARVELLARRYGWCPYRQLEVSTGRQAFRVEQAILRWWRQDLGLPPHLGRSETEGHTETVSLDAVNEQVVWQRIVAERDLALERAHPVGVAKPPCPLYTTRESPQDEDLEATRFPPAHAFVEVTLSSRQPSPL